MNITKEDFGTLSDGAQASLYTLANDAGMVVQLTDYGGIVVAVSVPDRNGVSGDVVLGLETLGAYVEESPYLGCLVGRYANRIRGGRFELGGKTYSLAQNDGDNHLHGGARGYDKVMWGAEEVREDDAVGVTLTYVSTDGEEGYPGTLTARVTYRLLDTNAMRIDYSATTDQDTVVNLTHHGYFNLACGGDILSHELKLHASRFTPITDALVPTGELQPVEGTPLDFRQAVVVGERIGDRYEQLEFGNGYDHNWVLDHGGGWLTLAAEVYEPSSGRTMSVCTTEPGIQFYSGNFLDGSVTGKGGRACAYRSGFCLETQRFPDSPNRPEFPSCVLRPGDTYQHTAVFAFGTR